MPKTRRSKEERDQEFIDAIEQMIGASLMAWQKPVALYIRECSLSGKEIDFNMIKKAKP